MQFYAWISVDHPLSAQEDRFRFPLALPTQPAIYAVRGSFLFARHDLDTKRTQVRPFPSRRMRVIGDDGLSRISAQNYAASLVDEIEMPRFVHRRFTVRY